MEDIRKIEFNTRMRILPKGGYSVSYLDNILIPSNGTSKEKPRRTINANEIGDLFKTKVRKKYNFTKVI